MTSSRIFNISYQQAVSMTSRTISQMVMVTLPVDQTGFKGPSIFFGKYIRVSDDEHGSDAVIFGKFKPFVRPHHDQGGGQRIGPGGGWIQYRHGYQVMRYRPAGYGIHYI